MSRSHLSLTMPNEGESAVSRAWSMKHFKRRKDAGIALVSGCCHRESMGKQTNEKKYPGQLAHASTSESANRNLCACSTNVMPSRSKKSYPRMR